jgi:hypothetical protein
MFQHSLDRMLVIVRIFSDPARDLRSPHLELRFHQSNPFRFRP